jgi:hypothetical protein
VFGGLHADGAALDDLWRYDTGSRLFYRINYFGVAHLQCRQNSPFLSNIS